MGYLIKKTECVYCSTFAPGGRQHKRIEVEILLPGPKEKREYHRKMDAGVCKECIEKYKLKDRIIKK